MLASNCQVPLTSILLLFELTRDYLIILPTLAAVGIRWGGGKLSIWLGRSSALAVAHLAGNLLRYCCYHSPSPVSQPVVPPGTPHAHKPALLSTPILLAAFGSPPWPPRA